MAQYELSEYREGLFRSGGSVRFVPQSLSTSRNEVRETNKGHNRLSFFRYQKNISIMVSGDSNQVQIGNNFKIGD